ncbi:MAG: hypothetical protein CYG60_10795 [Actinobacteria bacterium]|jgi:hypothetical protein|nr:MAG: hypothetical protein CYG60_10795 [Actinomycetota bacterium]
MLRSPRASGVEWGSLGKSVEEQEYRVAEKQQITWDPEADRRIKRSPFLMRRFIRKRIEDRVASRGRTHVTNADVDESAGMYRQYRFK